MYVPTVSPSSRRQLQSIVAASTAYALSPRGLYALLFNPSPPKSNDPNKPRLPDSTSGLIGSRLNLHSRVQSLIRAEDLYLASYIVRQSVFQSEVVLATGFAWWDWRDKEDCFLVTVMGLVIPWSFTLALLDAYTILVKCSIRQLGILLVIVVGDLVLSILTLAAASSSASLVDLLLRADETFCPQRLCSRYQISATMAFLSWLLSVASSLFNLWLLPALSH